MFQPDITSTEMIKKNNCQPDAIKLACKPFKRDKDDPQTGKATLLF